MIVQVAQLSHKDRVAGGLVMAKSGRLELGDNIYEYYKYSTTVTYLASKAIEFGEKKRKTSYAVQGHSRSSRSVSIESPYATFC